MSGPFVGSQWDDKQWYRSSRWNDDIEAEFEKRLQRARPENRAQYVNIQASHLCAQPDPLLRKIGRSLHRRAIAYGDDFAKLASEMLATNLAAEDLLDDAIETYREALDLVTASSNGDSFTSGMIEVAFAEALLRRGAPSDVEEASQALDRFDTRGDSTLGVFRSNSIRYLLVRADLHGVLGESELADEYRAAATRVAESPPLVTRPVSEGRFLELRPADRLAQIVGEVAPILKAAGFRKRRHSFNRTASDGITQVLSFQAGPSDPPRSDGGEPFFPSLHGKFTVNLAVHVPGMRDLGTVGTWVNEYSGQLRMRLGQLADDEGRDVWWETLHPNAGSDVKIVIQAWGLPWLDQFADAEAVLNTWREYGANATAMGMPMALDIGCLLVHRGRTSEAEQVLMEYLTGQISPQHLVYLRGFLPTIEMGHLLKRSGLG